MNILIHHHLGIGDCFICNGLVRTVVNTNRYDKIGVISKSRNANIISYMYKDDPRICVFPIHEGSPEIPMVNSIFCSPLFRGGELLRVGFELLRVGFDGINRVCQEWLDQKKENFTFDVAFYENAGIDYQQRWNAWKFVRDFEREKEVINKLNPSGDPYIFVHDDPDRGMVVNVKSNLKIIRNDKTINPLDMIGIFENASEIHCMESSIKCLIDQNLQITCPKYLHIDVRPDGHGRGLCSGSKFQWIRVEGK
jgi:hypothetical protein